MSVRRRAFIKNLAAMPREALYRRARSLTGREQSYQIGGFAVVLPPDSRLPYYQWRDATYDAYAAELLARASEGLSDVFLVDIGANVGDTAVMALAAASQIRVLSVEGSDYFLGYLKRNVQQFGSRAEVLSGFVGPVADRVTYRRDGGTGGFQAGAGPEHDTVLVEDWVSVSSLLEHRGADLTIWKTDTDGFDIHLVSQFWDDITAACDVVWLEYDPVGTLGPPEDVQAFIGQVAASDRSVHVYDNVGYHLCSGSAEAAGQMLNDLTEWLRQRRRGFAPVLYLDIWIATSDVASRMWPNGVNS